MTYAIAAAGTGGHVFPGLAIAEGLERRGVLKSDILFIGGDRFEAEAVPSAGYEIMRVGLRGLKRSFAPANLGIPWMVYRTSKAIRDELVRRGVRSMIATGGYVTVPAGWAARNAKIPFFIQEQNANAGLANRVMSRTALASFTSFPTTEGLPDGVYTGNPLRTPFVTFDRRELRARALAHYGLDPTIPVLGVVGGSLGAGVLNETVHRMIADWDGPQMQVVHLAGTLHAEKVAAMPNPRKVPWKVVPFEASMDLFFAASNLLLARAGGMVAEITATGTPAILVPGEFGSSGHQLASARYVEASGGAVIIEQANLDLVPGRVADMIGDAQRLEDMANRSRALGRPKAADDIAREMVAAHG